ncbi:MAG: DNA repair protein RadA [Fretibacterium sp.]|nr:DNA repair protein RadA [Fretibacterium sp.]
MSVSGSPALRGAVRYVCGECGHVTMTRTGRCPSCGAWGALVAERPPEPASASSGGRTVAPARMVSAVDVRPPKRISTGIGELDRVLGGGLVPGGVTLIGGQPGIGKSTLLLQAAGRVAVRGKPVLYISGEESEAQVALRASRVGAASDRLLLSCGADLEGALANLSGDIAFFALDSVQSMKAEGESGWPGTMTQVRAVAQRVVDAARERNIPAVMVGHITKDGRLAGPMLLEHMVDTVLNFGGEGYSSYRMLRAMKNRYGSTDELGVFEMREDGLVPVEDKSGLYWNRSDSAVPGVAMTVALEGTTPLAAELQTLASPTVFPYPRRTARGIELNRFQLLAAVIERRCGIPTGGHDLYMNVAGGLSIQDPSADLGACAAIASALKNEALPAGTCWLGEVGLAGEVRPVTRLGLRVKEAVRLGFTSAVVSSRERAPSGGFLSTERFDAGLELIPVTHLDEALAGLLLKKNAGPTAPHQR